MAENLDTISVQDYFTTVLPQRLASQTTAAPEGMEDSSYAIQYDIDGTRYATRVTGGNQVEVIEGSIEEPLVTITMGEAAWREAILNQVAAVDEMMSPSKMSASRLAKVRGLQGTFNLELTKEDGEVVTSSTVFNGTATPEVTLMMKADDYAKILRGELNSQMAFMQGKLKFKGDMNFLLKVGALM